MPPETEDAERRAPRRQAQSQWGRTAQAGIAGIIVLGIIAVTWILAGHADGATIGSIVAGIGSCVAVVAGRAHAGVS